MSGRGPVVNVTVTGNSKGAQSALHELSKEIPGLSGVMSKLEGAGGNLGATMGAVLPAAFIAAGAAVVEFGIKSVESFAEQAHAVLHFKEVSGLAAEEASKFVAVAEEYAVSAEDLSTAVGKLNKVAGSTPEKLQALNIELGKNAAGGYDAEQTFYNVVDAYNATDDASQKALIASTAFGKGWQSIVHILDQGSGKIKADFAAVKGYKIFNDADLQKAEDFRQAMLHLSESFKGIERELGEKIIPFLTELADRFTNLTDKVAAKDHGGGWAGAIISGIEDIGKAALDYFAPTFAFLDMLTKTDNIPYVQDQAAAIAIAIKTTDEAKAASYNADSDYASNNDYREFLDKQTAAAQREIDKLQKLFDAKKKDASTDLGVQRSWQNVTQSYHDMTDAVDAAAKAKGKDWDANQKVINTTIDYKQSIEDMAQADADSYAAKYAAQHENATADDLAAAADTGYRLSLIATLQKMDPNDPERKWLQDYINTLYGIPSDITTTITLNHKADEGYGKIHGYYASGTDYAVGGLSMVGEHGPELMNVPRGSQIWPHGTGPGGMTVIQNFPNGVTPQQVNDASRRWQYRNGVL